MPRFAIVAVLACALLALAAAAATTAAAHESGGTAVPSLATGATGPQVVALQEALDIEADGHFGPATRRAVRRFQRAHDLPVTGVADAATLAALGVDAHAASAAPVDAASALAQIAQCESGGDPTAVSPNGRYRGKYQFTRATWRGLGGSGDPAEAPEAEQDERAAALFAREGAAPWPSCGQGIE